MPNREPNKVGFLNIDEFSSPLTAFALVVSFKHITIRPSVRLLVKPSNYGHMIYGSEAHKRLGVDTNFFSFCCNKSCNKGIIAAKLLTRRAARSRRLHRSLPVGSILMML